MSILLALALTAATDKPDLSAYPELQPEALLLVIVEEMKRSLPDAYSARDMRLCAPEKVKFKAGKPVQWYVAMSFNAKNTMGGYSGIKPYEAVFVDGHIPRGVKLATIVGTGLDELFNRMIEKKAISCAAIPNETLRALLGTP